MVSNKKFKGGRCGHISDGHRICTEGQTKQKKTARLISIFFHPVENSIFQ
jgi:hypothetical protein